MNSNAIVKGKYFDNWGLAVGTQMVSTPTVLVRTEEAARMRVKHPPASFISAADSLLDLDAVHEYLHGHILGYITSLLDTYFIKNIQ